MVDIHNNLFHETSTFSAGQGIDSLYNNLLSILTRGLMTRESLKEILSYSEYQLLSEKGCWQDDDCLSLACHPDNTDYVNKYSVNNEEKGMSTENEHSSYERYVIHGNIVLIINGKILREQEVVKNRGRLNFEIQVRGNIAVDNIIAIGLREDLLLRDISRLEAVLNELMNGIKDNYYRIYGFEVSYIMHLLSEYSNKEIIEQNSAFSLESIRELLSVSKMEIPIVYTATGTEAYNYNYKQEKLRQLRSVYNDFCKVKNRIWK